MIILALDAFSLCIFGKEPKGGGGGISDLKKKLEIFAI